MPTRRIEGLYYITHVNNVPSILRHGILAHEKIEELQLPFTRIYDAQIVSKRENIPAPDGHTLWHFANLYFQPRNPMLYRVLREKSTEEIAIISVQPTILRQPKGFVSTGNAASVHSKILPVSRELIAEIQKNTNKDWWSDVDGSKRTIMAEYLIPEIVSPDLIQAIYVGSREVMNDLKNTIAPSRVQVVHEPRMFFQPYRKMNLTPTLTVVEGDMFFSRMQTLTVSVNCVGIMGKGLASTAKYQFPDVYVRYQDLCRQRVLKMGKPYLYKREFSFEQQLADDPSSLTNANLETWVLLFPTKHHWKEKADLEGIEKGLQWIQNNYKSEGIKSLALPALGCGLGQLEWKDVGPLMCDYLANLDIPIQVYLPTEKKVLDDELTRAFLIGRQMKLL